MKHYVCIIGGTPVCTVAANTPPEAQAGFFVELPPELEGRSVDELIYADSVVSFDPTIALARAKAHRIAEIKRQAQANITALAWRIERAQERDRIFNMLRVKYNLW